MIPTIGLMVGGYIVTRMLSLMTRKGERAESSVVRVFAALTLAGAVFGMWALVAGSVDLGAAIHELTHQ
jgi:hypothetical protein